MTPRTSALSVGVLALVIVLGHLSLFPRVADLDAFYHIGHALAYAEGSMFDSSLPWATQSIIGARGADLWWGFHVGLMPFTVIAEVDWAIRAAALMLTLTLALTVLWVLSRHNVIGSGWWTVFFFIAVPNVFFRHLMVRPHVVSLAAALALLSLMVRGRARSVFFVSILITWLHLSLFWLAPGIAIAYALVRLSEAVLDLEPGRESVKPSHALSAAFIGTVLGWLLRPDPIQAGMLANVQIVKLLLTQATQEPLTFAAELLPMPLLEMARTSWLFLAGWLMVVVGTLTYLGSDKLKMDSVPREERSLLLSALLISTAFAVLAPLSMRRAVVEWVGFGVLAMALFWTHVVYVYHRRSIKRFVAAMLVFHVGWGVWRHTLNVDQVAFEPDTLESSADFLEGYSEPGEVVFHARWDNFGPLLAFNRTNLYIGGMDPIFQFVHEPRLYWEHFYISTDVNVEWTCDDFPCSAGVATDTYTVLREHFGARWVVVQPRRNPRFSLYLLNDERYRLAHEAEHSAVFEIVDPLEAPPIGGGEPGEAEPDSIGGDSATVGALGAG